MSESVDTPQLPATVAQLDELRNSMRQAITEARQTLAAAQALYGTPAAQLAKVLEAIDQMSANMSGDWVSIEILSPDRDTKTPAAGYGNQKTIGETGWTVRLSKSPGPFTIVNQYTERTPTGVDIDKNADLDD